MSSPRKRPIDDDLNGIPFQDDPVELINQVTLTLTTPPDGIPTNVSLEYNNSKNVQNEIQAYAKISGCDWTFYVKSLNVVIGRNTEFNQNGYGDEETKVDIDLGPSKVVSRKHASINYNLNSRKWELKILGRNGLKIDGIRYSYSKDEGAVTELKSGNIIDVGGTQMMFILPDSSPVIAKQFLLNLKNKKLKNSDSSTMLNKMPTEYHQQYNFYNNTLKGFQLYNKQIPPQELSKPQSSSISYDQLSQQNQTQQSMIELDSEQDLSKDDAKDIKPPYSYATMITQAILTNEQGILSLSEIYDWISSHYSYYRFSKTGWQNSIRHNLSLNKAFEKVPRRPNEPGKGMKWQISEAYKQDFMKKWRDGTLNKVRRGSSVTRQLQLHLIKNKRLPESRSTTGSGPILQVNPSAPSSLPASAPQLPPMNQTIPFATHDVNSLNYINKAGSHLSSPMKYSNFQPNNVNSVGQGQPGPLPLPNSQPIVRRPESSQERSTQVSRTLQSAQATNGTSSTDLANYPASPQKRFLTEAYTPERSKDKNGTQNSSPALWNFVQFSTPIGPDSKDNKSPVNSPTATKNESTQNALSDLKNIDLAKGFKN